MGFVERVRSWLRGEGDEAADILAGAEERLDADLSRRERELAASPEERLATLQEQIAQGDADLEALRERIDRGDAGPPVG